MPEVVAIRGRLIETYDPFFRFAPNYRRIAVLWDGSVGGIQITYGKIGRICRGVKVMTVLERLLRHDAWTTRSLLLLCRELTDAELDREFDIGHRSLRRTFRHMVANMECWCDLMTGKPQRLKQPGGELPRNVAGMVQRLDLVGEELLLLGTSVVAEGREDDFFVDYLDEPPTQKPLGAGLVHVATHGMHHRAQCLYLMRLLGVKGLIEGDAIRWEQAYLGLQSWPIAR
ncbi:MAG: DinB family protein [Tepidisphaeraceae bacterium]